jgi:hypothetical protein
VNLVTDRQLIGDALAQLSAEHRAVICLAYYEGRTTAQIADDLQIAEATVKSRLHYALRALRRFLVVGHPPAREPTAKASATYWTRPSIAAEGPHGQD